MSDFIEVNFDGLVGPTHNYAGLAYGNVASAANTGSVSNPREAALQGLEKMRLLASWGIPQAILPPQPRPALTVLRSLGFSGSDAEVVASAHASDPVLLASCYSASSMWAANSATVSPTPDTGDRRLHMTPANLTGGIHRWIEADQTHRILQHVFADRRSFAVHSPLPPANQYGDEGAANHTRLCDEFGNPGIELFVFGRDPLHGDAASPGRFPGRQSKVASTAITRHHQLSSDRTVIAQQNPAAIDQGVFHNDVISVGHRNVLLAHEHAYDDSERVFAELQSKYQAVTGEELTIVVVNESRLTVPDAVKSYLFNSQIVTRDDGSTVMICPVECEELPSAKETVDWIVSQENVIEKAYFIDLRQSMRNGGGPACLRLRVVMSTEELKRIHSGVLFEETRFVDLCKWVNDHYRDSLSPEDLADAELIVECRRAMKALAPLLELPEDLLLEPF